MVHQNRFFIHEVLVYLTIDGEELTTTPEHPFLKADGQWTPAGQLEVGNAISRADGEDGTVKAVEFAATPQVMYNMTVADAHTYTVGDGEWVVHNSCNWLRGGKSTDRIGNILAEDAQFFWSRLPRGHKTVVAVAQGGDQKIVTAFIGASDDALASLQKYASQRGAKYVAPFENPAVWGSGHAEQIAYNYLGQYASTDLRIAVSHPDGRVDVTVDHSSWQRDFSGYSGSSMLGTITDGFLSLFHL